MILLEIRLYITLTILLILPSCKSELQSDMNLGVRTCTLLGSKFAATHPWSSYPIVFQPISRGRLSIWTGTSSLPTSELGCFANSSTEVLLSFDGYANKLEWTYYDSNKGSTHHGVSVNDCEDVQYRVTIKNKYENSYLDCNTIDKIERLNVNDPEPIIHTTCQDCNYPLITMINGQLRELFKLRINEEIADNLYWHLTQLLSNHHFNSPTSLNYNSD